MKTIINNIAMVAILLLVAMTTSNAAAQTITATMKNGTVYTYTVGTTADSVRYVGGKYGTATGEGIKIYPTGSTVSVDLLYSQMSSYTETGGSATSGNNKNANITSNYWNKNKGSSDMNYTPATAGFYRLEFPRIKDDSNSSWVQKSTDDYGVTFALEWDNSKVANRWTCYQMHAGNRNGSKTTGDAFKEDDELPEETRSTLSDYSNSGYSRGHLCPKADRKMSEETYMQTFYLSNMQPQWQGHNGGQWSLLEGDVRTWAGKCDTLYVVKAATIDDITLNGTTQSGVFDSKCNNRLLVPKYFYMALLAYDKNSQDNGDGTYHGTFRAIGIWTKHYNNSQDKEDAEYITIDELEARTGIDFFCNLPDDIEATVEATKTESYWITGSVSKR